MKEGSLIRMRVLVTVLIVGFTMPTAAQRGAVNAAAEIQRLRGSAYLVERDLSALSQRHATRAEQLQVRFEELQEEITYLKVKLRIDGWRRMFARSPESRIV